MKKSGFIKALFVDIGGVLLSNGWGHISRKMTTETFDLDFAELNNRHKVTVGLFESGKLTLEEYLNLVVFHEPRDFSPAQFQEFIFARSTPFPEMIEFVRQIKIKYGLKIVFVSNEGHGLNEYRIHKFQLDTIADSFISSCFVGLRKPDKDIFRVALETACVQAGQVIYIEDTKMFVEVAESLGIKSILHRDYKSTRAELASFGLEVGE